MHFKLVIVTVTYKEDVYLSKFIKTFNEYNDLANEARLIVVDNSPSDYKNIREFIESFDNIDYLSLPENPGFGAANNHGFQLHTSDYVLFINNDVEFTMPLFKTIIEQFKKSTNLGCVGIHQEGGAPSYFRKISSTIKDNSSFIDKEHFISGAFMFFKSKAFETIGMFDANLFMYGEEQDLSFRLIKNSYYTDYLPQLTFLHKVGDRKKFSLFSWKETTKSFCYLCKKYDIDYYSHNKRFMQRIKKLIIFFIIKLDFKEVKKLIKFYKFRTKYVHDYFK
jgi:GT2 family glycosyltransferase